jgi:uncharacterized protein YdhG (YjbR/CyaY superfamily)
MNDSLFQDYFKAQSATTQVLLQSIYQAIKQIAPDAAEKMSYGMPTFYLNGNLVHFAAYKNHIGFYPAPSGISNFIDELKPFKTSKGAIQFPIDKPMPLDLIQKITAFRVKENLNRKL